jgi:FMN phosphatase YigB (HAD superfamily)
MSRFWKFILILLAITITIYVNHLVERSRAEDLSGQSLAQPVTPSNTVFAFDINGVLLMADIPAIAHILWYEFPKKNLLFFLLNPCNWPAIIRTAIKQQRAEFFFEDLYRQFPQLVPLKPFYFKLFNAECLNEKVIALVTQLKEQGYRCYLFSDMGPKALAELMSAFEPLRTLFDGYFLPPCCSTTLFKRHPEFHERFKGYLVKQGQAGKQIIFIDDDPDNVLAARKAGLFSILFNSGDELNKIVHSLL